MPNQVHFPENSKAEKRWEQQFENPKAAPTSERVPRTEPDIPARDRWKKPRRRNPVRATMALPPDVANLDEIDWS